VRNAFGDGVRCSVEKSASLITDKASNELQCLNFYIDELPRIFEVLNLLDPRFEDIWSLRSL
jgi:hypothetical protein